MFDLLCERVYAPPMALHSVPDPDPRSERAAERTPAAQLTDRQRGILEVIEQSMRDRGYPPSVREIGESVGLHSPSTVHSHLNSLQNMGYLHRDPTKPRAIEVRWDPSSDAVIERRKVRHVPLVGDVAAGTDVLAQENVEELFPLPEDFTGTGGELFMLRVRGDSMIEDHIRDGDYVVINDRQAADNGEMVIALLDDSGATVKRYYRERDGRIRLQPANDSMQPFFVHEDDVRIQGIVVGVLRRY